jgi:hypothetical protein
MVTEVETAMLAFQQDSLPPGMFQHTSLAFEWATMKGVIMEVCPLGKRQTLKGARGRKVFRITTWSVRVGSLQIHV